MPEMPDDACPLNRNPLRPRAPSPSRAVRRGDGQPIASGEQAHETVARSIASKS